MTPSLVIVGEPHFLSSSTLRPRGPRVTLTARASCSTPARTWARACSLKSNCFAAMLPPIVYVRSPHGSGQAETVGLLLGENPEHVVLAEDDVLGSIDRHLGAAVLADEDAVALLDLQGDP